MELGWSTDYRILEEHQGTIEIDSDARQGTKVRIALPARESDVE